MQSITAACPQCKKFGAFDIKPDKATCPQCHFSLGFENKHEKFLECLFCDSQHFYQQKDFPQSIGCLLMVICILLVPKTYGLSLPLFFLLDMGLRKIIKDLVICYACQAEYRGFVIPKRIKGFSHHRGALYDDK